MGNPTDTDVFDLIADYKRDFGPTLPFEDARRLLVLYDEISVLFEKHLTPEEREEHNLIADFKARG
jgi:hypothetical protein